MAPDMAQERAAGEAKATANDTVATPTPGDGAKIEEAIDASDNGTTKNDTGTDANAQLEKDTNLDTVTEAQPGATPAATSAAKTTAETECKPTGPSTGAKDAEDHTNNAADKEEEQPKTEYHLLFCGSNRWNTIGRSSLPKAAKNRGESNTGEDRLTPTRFVYPSVAHGSLRSIFSGPNAAHIVAIDNAGRAFGLGRNEHAQLGKSDLMSRNVLVELRVAGRDDVRFIGAACSRAHTVLFSSDGDAFAVGSNEFGKLGVAVEPTDNTDQNNISELKNVALPADEKVISVACGVDFSLFACASGKVFVCGTAQYGQLGHGRTGEYIASQNKVTYEHRATPLHLKFPVDEVKIVQVAAGAQHSLALDSDGKVWSWGFGGYGRLGHKSPSDELRPRKIDTFDLPHYNFDFIACGALSSFAVQRSRKSTFFWGLTKRNGESNMYPKPVFDLHGNEIRQLCSGYSSTVASIGNLVVGWGNSPTFGELGLGEGVAKSSGTPKIMEPIEGLYCESLAEGMAFTVMIVAVSSDEDRKILQALEVVEFGADSEVPAEEEKSNGGGKMKRKMSKAVTPKGKGKKQRKSR